MVVGFTAGAFIAQPSVADASNVVPVITQEGYIFENDDGSSTDDSSQLAGSEFSSGKTLDSVRQGERVNLRMHLTNTGQALSATDELALFYDKNDGIWTKVQNQQVLNTGPSPSEDCAGFDDTGGSAEYECTYVTDGDDFSDAGDVSLAFDDSGSPWVAYRDFEASQGNLTIAQHVGAGGNCDGFDDVGGSDAWRCTTVTDGDSSADVQYLSLAFDHSGNPWIAFNDREASHGNLAIAQYVGSGGNCDGFDGTGGSDAWQCTTITDGDNLNDAQFVSLAFDTSGSPWVSFYNSEVDGNLTVAQFVTSGGNCDGFDDVGGSDAWQCTTVTDGDDSPDAQYTSLAFDPSGNAWVAFHNAESSSYRVTIAQFVTSGGNCDGFDDVGGSDAWQCTTVTDGDNPNDARYKSLMFDDTGNPWIVFRDFESSQGNTVVAQYVTSGGNCDGFDQAGGSDAWQCTTVIDGDNTNDALSVSLSFDASGNPWLALTDVESSQGNTVVAQYVTSGGNCDGFDDVGGSDAWQCTTVTDGDNSFDVQYVSLAVSPIGNVWVAFRNHQSVNQGALAVINLTRSGEISIVPSLSATNGSAISESHTDMTSSTNTANRDDADCLNGSAVWNDGTYFETEEGSGLSLAAGTGTPQCTEVMWTLDTSQALLDTSYRFMVATKDSFRADKGLWRGPTAVATDGYPQLTVLSSGETTYRYSKATLGAFTSDCTNTAWGCTNIRDTGTVGRYGTIKTAPNGDLWTVFVNTTALPFNIITAKYVGQGGDCDTAGGSDAWDCSDVGSATINVSDLDMSFDATGKPWLSFASNSSFNFIVAEYVGSGGSGNLNCSSEWECTTVWGGGTGPISYGAHSSMVVDSGGHPWVAHLNNNPSTPGDEIKLSRHVGSGGNCDTVASGSDAWQCYTLDSTGTGNKHEPTIGIGANNDIWVAFRNGDSGSSLIIARYVSAGGGSNCTGANFICTIIDDRTGTVGESPSLNFDSNGNPTISYYSGADTSLSLASYVGSGGNCDSLGTGSDAWQCTVLTTAGTSTISDTSLAFDANGDPWIAFSQFISPNHVVKTAHYVGSGGNCDTEGGPDAWQCDQVVSNSNTKDYVNLAFDINNLPSIYYWDSTTNDGIFAQMKLPPNELSATVVRTYNGRDASPGDLGFRLSSGRSPVSDPYGTCRGAAGLLGYCGSFHPDGAYETISALSGERPTFAAAANFGGNSQLPTGTVHFRTDSSPATDNVILQVYRYGSTNSWETIATYNSAGCSSANCVVRGVPTGTPADYFYDDGTKYWVYFRVYQQESASGIDLEIDSFTALQTTQSLRSGQTFRDQNSDPIRW